MLRELDQLLKSTKVGLKWDPGVSLILLVMERKINKELLKNLDIKDQQIVLG